MIHVRAALARGTLFVGPDAREWATVDETGSPNDDHPPADGDDTELGGAVDDAMEAVRHEAIMRVWQSVVMTNVESVRPPRDDDDPIRRLYEQGERGRDEPPS